MKGSWPDASLRDFGYRIKKIYKSNSTKSEADQVIETYVMMCTLYMKYHEIGSYFFMNLILWYKSRHQSEDSFMTSFMVNFQHWGIFRLQQ